MNWLYSVGAVLLSLGFACTAAQAAAVTFDPEDEQGVTLAAGEEPGMVDTLRRVLREVGS